MKKIAMVLSVVALVFAYSSTTVSAQNAPKTKTEKVAVSKTTTATDAQKTQATPATNKAKAGCAATCIGDKAKAGCAATCTGDKAKSGCCSGHKAAATPVPASDKK